MLKEYHAHIMLPRFLPFHFGGIRLSICRLSPLPLVHNNPLNIRKTIAAELAVICPPPPSLKPALSCNQSRRLARSPLRPSRARAPARARARLASRASVISGICRVARASAFPPFGPSLVRPSVPPPAPVRPSVRRDPKFKLKEKPTYSIL